MEFPELTATTSDGIQLRGLADAGQQVTFARPIIPTFLEGSDS
jgi:hypothetical protein